MTPRENLLETLGGGNPQWIPVCPYLFPNENPTEGIPKELAEVLSSTSGNLAGDIQRLGDYLGAEDFALPVPQPVNLVSDTCPSKSEPAGKNKQVDILSTPKGDLRRVVEYPEGYPSLVTERYVKTVEDAARLTEYFRSLRIEPTPTAVAKIKDAKARLGNCGILFCRTVGTPLGMCYRVYSDITNLIYMLMDAPETMAELFAAMEEKYFQLYERMLQAAPEIDAFLGMDDTSTTLISPAMFEQHNVALTNRRADLCHAHQKLYLHHSCGLLRDLLPVYHQTRMDGVDAFTAPPIGNVGYAEGRKLLGLKYSLRAGLNSGLPSLAKNAIRQHVADRFADARAAGHVAFSLGGANLTFPAMELMFAEAQKINKS